MTTVIEDMRTLMIKIYSLFSWVKKLFKVVSFLKKVKTTTEAISTAVPSDVKVGFFQNLNFKIFPKAQLTYWLADEEVVIYVDKFQQKDKFKLVFRELISGKTVLVNSATPINYRLVELKSTDKISETVIQQDQRFN
jgi:hypothetical protein